MQYLMFLFFHQVQISLNIKEKLKMHTLQELGSEKDTHHDHWALQLHV